MNKEHDTVMSEKKAAGATPAEHQESLIDQAVAETFPASDPISPAYEKSLAPVAWRNDDAARWRAWLKTALPYIVAGAAGAALYAAVTAAMTPPRRFNVLRDSIRDRVRRLTRH